MRRALGSALLTGVVLLTPGATRAAGSGASPGGFEVAFRSGLMVPLGDAAGGNAVDEGDWTLKLSEAFGLQFPLWLDVGYRIDRVFVGAYGQYAFGLGPAGGLCGGGSYSCSSTAVRVGFELQFHLFDRPADQSRVDPWFGVGFGYEWATSRESRSVSPEPFYPLNVSSTYQGWDFLRLGVGLDFGLGSTLALGPFLECSLGQFQQHDQTLEYAGLNNTSYTDTYSGSIQRKTLHFWFAIGLKLTWRP